MDTANPILVRVTRGEARESIHRGRAVVMDARGRVIAGWGDGEAPVTPRSAIKPLQAISLVESGAADAFGLSDEEIALACASHSSEPRHVARVAAWLERLGLSAGDLECGPHLPLGMDRARAMIRAGEEPTALHNNCSGKHAGFLTTALHLKEPAAGYIQPGHAVQRRWQDVLSEMSGYDLAAAPRGTDGCGIPVVALPLTAMARAMARLADPSSLPKGRATAARRITGAMTAHPSMVGGRGRLDTIAMEAGRGTFVTKTGAEGVYCAALMEKGWGVALKIDDGAKRAAETAMAALLRHLGVLNGEAEAALKEFLETPVVNAAGETVGAILPEPGWPNAD